MVTGSLCGLVRTAPPRKLLLYPLFPHPFPHHFPHPVENFSLLSHTDKPLFSTKYGEKQVYSRKIGVFRHGIRTFTRSFPQNFSTFPHPLGFPGKSFPHLETVWKTF